MKLLYENQSQFKLIQVYEDQGSHYLLLEGRDEIHSEYDDRTIMLTPVQEHYWNYLTLFGLVSSSIKKVLIIGLGAGTCARQLLAYRPDAFITGVEIDKEIVDVGAKYFGLDLGSVTVHIGDAISFLEKSSKKYDYIIVDAFIKGNLGKQFLTLEFYRLIKSHLNSKGLVGINYIDENRWSSKIIPSVSSVFKNVRQVGIPTTYNKIMLASDVDYDLSLLDAPDSESKRLKKFIISHIKQLSRTTGDL